MLRSLALRVATAPVRRAAARGRALRASVRGEREGGALPYDMFDFERTRAEVHAAQKLAGIYHKGQDRAWSGKVVLAELLEKHEGLSLSPEVKAAIGRVFTVILWGELAAWKISANLALRLEPLEAKLAATSQAHDEARHFYTMHDYLTELGVDVTSVPPSSVKVMTRVLNANALNKQLLGMQLMIEPMALTIFQLVRQSRIEPVLADLLALYERDEARHVALGVLHLPKLIQGLSPIEAADLWSWTFSTLWSEFDLLADLASDLAVLGIDPREVARVGRDKQVKAISLMLAELGTDLPAIELIMRACDARIAWTFPHEPGVAARFTEAVQAAMSGDRAENEQLTFVPA